jgi:hypothetical protein
MVDISLLDLASPNDFRVLYDQARSEFPHFKPSKIYEDIEARHKTIHNRRLYSNFRAFRNSRKK